MAEGGGEYEFHDLSHSGDDDVFKELSPLQPGEHVSLRNELLKDKVNSFYESVGEVPNLVDPNQFKLDRDDHLFVKTDKGEVQLTYKKDPTKFRQLKTIQGEMGVGGVRRYLSLSDAKGLSSKSIKAFETAKDKIPSDREIEMTELKKLPEMANTIVQETSFTEEQISQIMQSVDEPPLPLREIYGLNRALQTIRGELTNNIAKLGELDEHIKRERVKLVSAEESNLGLEVKERIEKRLVDLEVERSARLEVIGVGKEKLRTQANRVRETINKILHEDTTLRERLRTLFREQGVSIASVITAMGFIISTIVLAVTGGPVSTLPPPPSPPSPPSDPKDFKSWAKKQLHHMSDLLKMLGQKALDALPGIIGSAVSFLFNSASKVIGFMANNLWTLILLLVGWLAAYLKK